MTENLKRRLILRWRERDDDADNIRTLPMNWSGHSIDMLMSRVADMIADAQHLGALESTQAQTPVSMGADDHSSITDPFELPEGATFPPGLISGLHAIGVTQDQARAVRDNIHGNNAHSRDSHAFWDSLSSHLRAESIEPRPKPPALSDWAKVCQALDLPASDTTAEQIVESIECLRFDLNKLCSVVGLVKGGSADDIEESVLALYREISEAQHTLAPYCAEADPGRVDLGGVVSMLVNEVLEPRQVQREQAESIIAGLTQQRDRLRAQAKLDENLLRASDALAARNCQRMMTAERALAAELKRQADREEAPAEKRELLHDTDQNRWVYFEGEAGFAELDSYNPGDSVTYWNRPLIFIERRWTGERRSSGKRACLFTLGTATWTQPKTTQ